MKFKIKLALLIVLFLGSIVSLYALFKEARSNILTVTFLNIGQGDAVFIEAPSGNQMLIDSGPGRSILRELSKVMPFYDRSIDVVLATHPDADHIGGLPDVLGRYKIDWFVESGVESDTGLYQELESRIMNYELSNKTKKILARRGMVVDLGGGAILQILFPDRDPRGMETNTASIVARLVYGESEFLLTGDSPINIESYLVSLDCLKCPLALHSDVLKAGHHGSKTSTSQRFVSLVSPQYVVISAGKDNKYGHPHQEVLDTL
ncbi:MAG: MBL fold metallo-hydrolase, partial [Patescibacteria group bacterium]